VAAAAAVFLSGFQRPGDAPAPAALRGVPPYAVLLGHGGATATVLDLFTGKHLGQVDPPGAGSDFEWVTAAADDRSFVLADQKDLVIRFYLLRLTAGGSPARLTRLNVPSLRDAQIYGIALTADASRLAVAWQNNPVGPVTGRLAVTTLATGDTRIWSTANGGASTVSWAGDRTVAFYYGDNANDRARSGLRLLDTAAAGANLLDSRLILPATTGTPAYYTPDNPVITLNGSTVLAGRSTNATTDFVTYSAATGKLRAVLTPAIPSPETPWYCGILWADPAGGHLIIQCGTTQASIEDGHYARIHLDQLIPASPVGEANTFAW
jgi:hypothetical protein